VSEFPKGVRLIGAAGRMRAGKDTFLAALGQELEKQRIGVLNLPMAWALKTEIAGLMVGLLQDHPEYGKLSPLQRHDLVVSWMQGASRPEKERMRLLMQWWGTEFRREMYSADYWIEWHRRGGKSDSRMYLGNGRCAVLVPDVRFRDEADYVRENGLLFRVTRPSVEPDNSHRSETALDDYRVDAVILNDRTQADLEISARLWARELAEALW